MIDKNTRFISPVGRLRDLHVAGDEPSHIHIARPSRLLRRDSSGFRVEPTDQAPELAGTEVIVQVA